MPDLSFNHVSITYRARRDNGRGHITAVRDVNLTLPSGGTLGIAGESGSGKSTLVMSVLRLLPANAQVNGEILVGDKNVNDLNFGQLRALRWADAAIVFQGAMHSLNPVHTVGAQILEALELHVKDTWNTAALRKARLRELLDHVEIPHAKAEAYPHQLSGGQKQRIMIAMALACEPDIIIADEPTTALDVIVQAQVLAVLRRLVTENGISMLMISHDLSVLAAACERIAVMREGEVVEVGTAHDMCTSPSHEYTQQLAAAFPTIGDPTSRLRPVTRKTRATATGASDSAGETAGEIVRTDEKLLEAVNLSVTYRTGGSSVRAVKNVNLACHKGEIMALVGQSGSGKTSLARTLLGLEKPDPGGEVRFRGEVLTHSSKKLRAFRKQVQLIMQDPTGSLNPKVSVYESVAEGLRIQRYPGDERALVTAALESAELTPAGQFFGAIPQELSGGQRQRVVIASALALHPEILIADEPVASLDASARGEILALLLDLKNHLGLSALVITHDLGLAWNIADTVAVMYQGEIVEYGACEDVLLRPQHEYTQRLLAAVPRIERTPNPVTTDLEPTA